MDEFSIIKAYFAPLAKDFSGSLNLADDAALISPSPDEQLVITKDAICEGIHFIGDETPALIAQKLLRVNLSDIAAKGARPLCYFLAIMTPRHTPAGWFAEFARGLAADQQQYDISLAGGDTTATNGALALSLTMIATVPKGGMLHRSGAKPGDIIYVSGTLGDSALGLLSLQGKIKHDGWLQERYQLPQPRMALGEKLRGIASSSMDISDGLMQDLGHMCSASDAGATIYQGKLPLSSAVQTQLKKNSELWEHILGGGDDYELLFTAPPGKADAVTKLSSELALPITAIGKITGDKAITLLDAAGKPRNVEHKGFRHF